MIEIDDFLSVAKAYQQGLEVPEKTVSYRVFGDSKKLTAIRGGADITVGRYNAAIAWFSENWPPDVEWPLAGGRPNTDKVQVAAE